MSKTTSQKSDSFQCFFFSQKFKGKCWKKEKEREKERKPLGYTHFSEPR